jgi:putative transcriptional regulator
MARSPKVVQPDQAPATGEDGEASEAIIVKLDELLAERGMTLTELAERVGITIVNLSVLKNGRARAIRFSTLARLCAELGCQPGDLLRYEPGSPGGRSEPAPR